MSNALSHEVISTPVLTVPVEALESEKSPVFIRSATIATSNARRLAEFYTRRLGFEQISADAMSVTLGADGVGFLKLETRADAEPFDARSSGLFHIAYLIPDRAGLARWFMAARAAGVAFEGASDHAVSEAFYLTDPEGNGIEVYVDRARENWPRDAGGYAMTTGPMALRELVVHSEAAADMSPRLPTGTRIGHIHLQTGDAERSARFWQERLGVAETHRRPGARFLSWGGYHHHIALNNWRSHGSGPRKDRSAGLVAVEFAVRGEAELEKLATQAHATRPDPASFDMIDPDGLELRFRVI
ncbi:MAG: VOC family protein [Rhizobiales bacterium]|nr:VOC family protein [Hyphomicrobiales bacterium]